MLSIVVARQNYHRSSSQTFFFHSVMTVVTGVATTEETGGRKGPMGPVEGAAHQEAEEGDHQVTDQVVP